MTDPQVYTQVIAYRVCAVPPEYPEAWLWAITVEWRGIESWAVLWRDQCVGKRGNRSPEPLPSARTDAWLRAYRHDEQTALRIARRWAPKVKVNGRNAQDYIDWFQREGTSR